MISLKVLSIFEKIWLGGKFKGHGAGIGRKSSGGASGGLLFDGDHIKSS